MGKEAESTGGTKVFMRWPVGVLFALGAVWLMLITPWKETIPPTR